MTKEDVLKVLKDVEFHFNLQSDMSTFCQGYNVLKKRIEEIELTGHDYLIDEEQKIVKSTCNDTKLNEQKLSVNE
jgi:hypothetical protein